MRFALPHMLWLLVLVPFIGAGLVWAAGYRRTLLSRFGTEKVLVRKGIAAIGTAIWVRMAMFLLAVVCMILALARPQWGYHERQVITHGVDMVVAIDTSDSMMARDFQPNRLSRAKELLRNLIWEAQGDRVGIVAFSGTAVVMCPLTLDYKMAATALKAVDVNTVSAEGTNIGSAIQAAKGAFDVSGANDRVLVLLTDGEQLDRPEDLDRAVADAAEQGIKIFAIGLGSDDGAVIPTMAGPKRSRSGDLVQTRLNFEKLEEIAEKTNGEAIRAEKVGAGEIAEISAALSKYRGRKQQDKTYRIYHDRYPWFVGAAAVSLLLEALMSGAGKFSFRRRRVSNAVTGISLFGLLVISSPAQLSAYPGEGYVRSRDALRKFQSGEFDQSAQLYGEAAEATPGNKQIQFNLGAAAAKAGKTAEARESLGKVYDPENPTLNAFARYGVATLDHRELRKQIGAKKEEWASAAAEGSAPREDIQEAVAQLKDIIEEYKQSILSQPQDLDMKANYELAKKDLEELEELLKENQQQQQQQQQEQQQENQQEQQEQQSDDQQQEQGSGQQQQGEQGQDQQEQGEQGQDQQPPEQPQDKQGEQQDQQQNEQGQQQENQQGQQDPQQSDSQNKGEQKEQQGQPEPQGTPAPTPTPSPQGTPRPGQNQGEGQEPADQGEPVPIGQMSPTDVDRLLNTLPPEDQQALQLMMGAPTEDQDLEHDW